MFEIQSKKCTLQKKVQNCFLHLINKFVGIYHDSYTYRIKFRSLKSSKSAKGPHSKSNQSSNFNNTLILQLFPLILTEISFTIFIKFLFVHKLSEHKQLKLEVFIILYIKFLLNTATPTVTVHPEPIRTATTDNILLPIIELPIRNAHQSKTSRSPVIK